MTAEILMYVLECGIMLQTNAGCGGRNGGDSDVDIMRCKAEVHGSRIGGLPRIL